jgi:hypothetical protein
MFQEYSGNQSLRVKNMIFDDRYHLHVGYYEEGHDLEAIFMKVQNEDKWCMFFDQEHYKTSINLNEFEYYKGFGLLVREYFINGDLSFESGSKFFKDFLLDNKII